MTRQKIVIANWKMNGSVKTIQDLLLKMNLRDNPSASNIVICPSSIYLSIVREHQANSAWMIGAQNVYPANQGAYTGEVSGPMLYEMGCKYVLVGHSERRNLLGESNEFVADKFQHVKDCGMIPVLCIGETLTQRQQGATEAVLTEQLEVLYKHSHASFNNAVVAYEPVWAIGTGLTATPEQVQQAHTFIRSWVRGYEPQVAEKLSILYGGSVTPETATDLFKLTDVDGALVGGASLDAERFLGIVRCIKSYY